MEAFRIYSSLIYLLLVTRRFLSFTCGPDRKCICDFKKQMNCSKTVISIKDICEFIFKSTDYKILSLQLERNRYNSVKKFDLKGCSGLTKLYLGGNMIGSIEKGSFSYLDRLELLDIQNNVVDIYDHTVQESILFPPTLKILMLNRNLKYKNDSMSYPNLFYLSYLSVLYIDGLPDNTFPDSYRSLKQLTTLVLSGMNGNCNILQISNSTFRNLPYLRILNISSCNIENIDAGAFQNLPLLEVLDLSENLRLGFRMLENVTFGLQFTNIKSLNYSKVYSTFGIGTKLTKRDICYLWNTTLNEVVMSKNRVELVETNVAILFPDTVKILRVEDNTFTFGPYMYQLGCLNHLEEFYGSYQNTAHNPVLFEKEPVEMFDDRNATSTFCPFINVDFLRNISKGRKNCNFFEDDRINISKYWPMFPKTLRRFEFSRCNMNYDVISFPVIPFANNIEYIDFSGNVLYSWTGPVGPVPKLKYLNLSRNYCSNIGLHFFDSGYSLENLQLQENFLGLVLLNEVKRSVIFQHLTHLKVLNLSSNIISYIPPLAFSKLSKLEVVDLSVNNIVRWTIYVKHLNNLLHLHLKSNSLRMLPKELRNKLESNSERLGKHFTVDLSNNTITTYCDDTEYLKWIVEHRKNFINFDNYIFRTDSGGKLSQEQFIAVVNGLDKACSSYTLTIVLSFIGLTVLLAITAGGFIYKNRWQLRYLIRTLKLRHFDYRKLQDHSKGNENYIYDVFVSYANENFRFILDKMIPNLENQNLNLCVHDRDFLPGKNIADNILDAIRNSRKTVVVLSKDFLKSKWCIYEFNMARMESIYSREGRTCLLVVMYEGLPAKTMTTEMLEWLRSNTYIEYTVDPQDESVFWYNLKEALSE